MEPGQEPLCQDKNRDDRFLTVGAHGHIAAPNNECKHTCFADTINLESFTKLNMLLIEIIM